MKPTFVAGVKQTQFRTADRSGPGADHAKQSQLAGREPPAEIPHYSSILLFHHSNPMLIVRNKTPTTKVPESESDLRFWADTKGPFG